MASFTISPNMSLIVPVTGVDPGPDWANNLNASLSIIDAHNHSLGSGVQITPSGINISSDLSFNANNAIAFKSVRFTSQASPLSSGSDIGCLYESGVDLYYNDGSGNQIRITQGGSVAGATGTITGLPSGTASASYASSSGTFVFQQATSTAANLDVASIAIRYPGSYPSPAGNFIQLQAPTSLSSGYALTLPALPGANNTFLTINTSGSISSNIVVDNSTLAISSNNIIVKASGITTNELADNSVTTSKIVNSSITLAKMNTLSVDQPQIVIRNVVTNGSTASNGAMVITASSGNASFGAGNHNVNNLVNNYTVIGNPVFIGLQPDGKDVPNSSYIQLVQNSLASTFLAITRNGVSIATFGAINGTTNLLTTPSGFNVWDNPGAGTFTYRIQVVVGSGVSATVNNVSMVIYEIK